MKSAVVICICLVVAASANPFPLELIEENGRIANGENAKAGQFPYQVGLFRLKEPSNGWCGGSLISKNWISTVAHCVKNVRLITAFLGSTVRKQGKIIRYVDQSNMFILSDFDTNNFKNDVALLKIDTVPLSSDVQIVKLPSASAEDSYVNQAVVVSGWGLLGDSKKKATYLQYANLEIVPNSVCADYYKKYFHPTNICVATPDRTSTCAGDSGGPLVLQSGDKVRVGLVSFAAGGACEKRHPVAFTRVSSYLDWIKKQSGVFY